MSDSSLRDQVARQARSDPAAALSTAQRIPDAWYRAQALAWVARFAADQRVVKIAREALQAATEGKDAYQQVAATAWPLRALLERDQVEPATRELYKSLQSESAIAPPSSRSEALLLLLNAVFALGPAVREDLARRLQMVHASDAHWRTRRNLLDALGMLTAAGDPAAARLAEHLPPKDQTRIAQRSAAAEPRPFFW